MFIRHRRTLAKRYRWGCDENPPRLLKLDSTRSKAKWVECCISFLFQPKSIVRNDKLGILSLFVLSAGTLKLWSFVVVPICSAFSRLISSRCSIEASIRRYQTKSINSICGLFSTRKRKYSFNLNELLEFPFFFIFIGGTMKGSEKNKRERLRRTKRRRRRLYEFSALLSFSWFASTFVFLLAIRKTRPANYVVIHKVSKFILSFFRMFIHSLFTVFPTPFDISAHVRFDAREDYIMREAWQPENQFLIVM